MAKNTSNSSLTEDAGLGAALIAVSARLDRIESAIKDLAAHHGQHQVQLTADLLAGGSENAPDAPAE